MNVPANASKHRGKSSKPAQRWQRIQALSELSVSTHNENTPVDSAFLLQKIETLTSKVEDLELNRQDVQDRSPHRLALQSIPAAVRARTILASSISREPEDFQIHQDVSDAEQISQLRAELAASYEIIAELKDEVKRARDTAVHDIYTGIGFDSEEAKPADRESAASVELETYTFPQLNTARTASPLPSPDPGVSSAFLNGSGIFQVNQNGENTPSPWTIPPSVNMDRRQSEPTLTVPSVRSLKYTHLTFFPNTSNTPRDGSTDSGSHADSIDQNNVPYRKIDRGNWSVIVDRIINSNDQQASVTLQQKLKIAPSEQRLAMIDAIVQQAFPLMINRFGNFLIQRCFEYGSSEQINAIANCIIGNVLILARDSFGCHVVQKAFDNVSDEFKTLMVNEMLSEIRGTVTHRYACHVWQKLFEVRWQQDAPQIMSHVNAELIGSWDQIALGETGSLVVQNIFENCLEVDRRPCIDEVLASISQIIRGQWGNWVIQHIVEHGSTADRQLALDNIMTYAVDYSTDQYASKVLEKAIKTGGPDLLSQYLEAITKSSEIRRPRIPLIDIASDQYGNYLIQYILVNGSVDQKQLVSSNIKKHMVSMRGSRYGAKVAFTVERMRGDGEEREYRRRSYR